MKRYVAIIQSKNTEIIDISIKAKSFGQASLFARAKALLLKRKYRPDKELKEDYRVIAVIEEDYYNQLVG